MVQMLLFPYTMDNAGELIQKASKFCIDAVLPQQYVVTVHTSGLTTVVLPLGHKDICLQETPAVTQATKSSSQLSCFLNWFTTECHKNCLFLCYFYFKILLPRQNIVFFRAGIQRAELFGDLKLQNKSVKLLQISLYFHSKRQNV